MAYITKSGKCESRILYINCCFYVFSTMYLVNKDYHSVLAFPKRIGISQC